MPNTERSIRTARQGRRNRRAMPDSLAGSSAHAQHPAGTRASLYIAWNNAAALPTQQSPAQANGAVAATLSVRPDIGLWLLGDAFVRRHIWSDLSNQPDFVPSPFPQSHRSRYVLAKRAADIAGSLILLTALLPLLLLIAALIRIDSPGPALFRQRRVGKDGHEFLLWKFRSMQADSPHYAPSPTTNLDPRLTRVGRLIRRISFDELPQLINVLSGEMSLVGPRPEMPFIVARYTDSQRRRLAVKPGITGLWQVSPARALPIHENLHYDLHYILHQNLLLDGAILLRTVAAVIRGVGAV